MLLLIGTAWLVDQRPPETEGVIVSRPGLSITELSVAGEKATVEIETDEEEDGALYLWLELDEEGSNKQREQR